MDRRERVADSETALRESFDGLMAGVWTTLPGIIESFDPVAMTCEVQPAIRASVRQLDGTVQSVDLPLLVDCPAVFPCGGGVTLTFPIEKGDECLIHLASRCIDGWWQAGGIQEQAEYRMHSLSDGFVQLGPRSRPRVIQNVSTSAAQLRSDSGNTYIELNPNSGKIKIVAPGGFDVISPQSTFSAKVTINGLLTWTAGMIGSAVSGVAAAITGMITANGKRIDDTHTHSNVQPGSGNSGTVN
jgi:hypothetical protein